MKEPSLAMRLHELVDRLDALLWRLRHGLDAWLQRLCFRLWVLFGGRCPVHPTVPLARNVACILCAVDRRERQSTLRRGAGM